MEEGRPDPEAILDMVKNQNEKENRGKLTIFLGYSAGVGKTYAMLQEAKAQKKKGVDVVIGTVTTHGRKDTQYLARGIEKVPLRRMRYRGITLEEMDADAVIARKPQIALVDELAHTDIPESRHAKRYLDVMELLNSGIDVYTTLNIQHLEGMNSTIEEITGIHVKETIPDSVLNEADAIKLVDISPNDLLNRFREGKVYIPEQAERAAENFFNEGNLIALRELAFRAAAEHVDEKMTEYLESQLSDERWVIKEKILVCIGDNQFLNERLIQSGKRLANEMRSDWKVLYVEAHAHNKRTGTISEAASKGLEMATSLGAVVETTRAVSITKEIIRYANKENVSVVMVGRKPNRRRHILSKDISVELVKEPLEFDLWVIDHRDQNVKRDVRSLRPGPLRHNEMAYQIIIGTLAALAVLALNLLLFYDNEDYWFNAMMMAVLCTVICSMYMNIIPAIYSAILNALAVDFFFIPSYGSLSVINMEAVLALVAFFVIALAVSLISTKIRDEYIITERKYNFISAKYELSSELNSAVSVDAVLEAAERILREEYDILSVIFMSQNETLMPLLKSSDLKVSAKDHDVAAWVFRNGSPAGKGTDTMSSSEMKFFPMKLEDRTLGAIGVKFKEDGAAMQLESEKLVRAFAKQISIAIVRIVFSDEI